MSKVIEQLGLYGNNYIPEFSVGDPIIYYTISGDSFRYVAQIRSQNNFDANVYPKEIVLEKRFNDVVAINLDESPYFLPSLVNWIEEHLTKMEIKWINMEEYPLGFSQ